VSAKDVYQKQYQAQLRDWDATVKQWKAQTSNTREGLRPLYEDELKALGTQRALAQKRLNELLSYLEDTWEPLRERAEEAWHELLTATDKASKVFGLPARAGRL